MSQALQNSLNMLTGNSGTLMSILLVITALTAFSVVQSAIVLGFSYRHHFFYRFAFFNTVVIFWLFAASFGSDFGPLQLSSHASLMLFSYIYIELIKPTPMALTAQRLVALTAMIIIGALVFTGQITDSKTLLLLTLLYVGLLTLVHLSKALKHQRPIIALTPLMTLFIPGLFHLFALSTNTHLSTKEIALYLSCVLLALGLNLYFLIRHAFQIKAERTENDHLHYLGLLAAEICHEMASPLMVIDTSLILLKNKLSPSSNREMEKSFSRMNRQIKRLHDILIRFRNLSIVRSENMTASLVNIEAAFDEAATKIQFLSGSSCIKKNNQLQAQTVALYCEQSDLEQMFTILLKNGIEAVESTTPQLEVELRDYHSQVELVFTDNGRGFSKKEWRLAVRPFHSSKKNSLSAGLGLPIVIKILEKSGGSIELTSEYPTTLLVKLPKVPGAQIQTDSPSLEASQVL